MADTATKTEKPAKASKPAKSTTKAKAPKAPESEPKDRRSRGLLETDVLHVVKDFEAGKVKLEDGQTLTPHRIATLMVKTDSLDTRPSAGAISNIVAKWVQIGFATAHAKPFAFKGITAAGKKDGLDTLKQKAKDKKAKEKVAGESTASSTSKPPKASKPAAKKVAAKA